ncbi:polyprenyl synthetase family protein [Virgibacillus kekensis]|uniref:Polyprenyl synthetase family protein n=1 Tax=Virgibacillus kekensis TaxID=202261 RepID=A0ABV9DJK8_9BACI
MQHNLSEFIEENKKIIQEELSRQMHNLTIPEQLKDSMVYSVKAGGKRLRPLLMLASFKAYSEDMKRVLSSAVALEFIHTYSLIHDDLPAMDDDDLRRGEPTNHKVFNEATAILAGDALLTYSFEIIANEPALTETQKVVIIKHLAKASGPNGMVGGQILDMEAEKREITLEELETIHKLKTGELLKFAVRTGAYLGGATDKQIEKLDEYSHYLGLIFQVQDDILDVTGDQEKIGKPVGSDELNEKNTYPKLLGLQGAIEKKDQYVNMAKQALEQASAADSYLMDFTDYISNRDH